MMTEERIDDVIEAVEECGDIAVDDGAKIGIIPIAIGVVTIGAAGWLLYKTGELVDKKLIKPTAEKIKAKKAKRKLERTETDCIEVSEDETV